MPLNVKSITRPGWTPLPYEGCVNVEVQVLSEFKYFFLALLRFHPNGTIHEHSADIDIDVICLEGEGMTSINGETAPFKAGQKIHWPAGLSHQLWTENKPMKTLMVEHQPEAK